MTIKEYLKQRYRNEKLIYPFLDSHENKFVFAYVMNDLRETEYKKNVFSFECTTNMKVMDVYDKLKQSDKIELLCMATMTNQNKMSIELFITDEDLLTACQLIGDSNKVLELLLK